VELRWTLHTQAAGSLKDQTYFLWITQDQLSRTLFPLGGMMKPEVEVGPSPRLALAEASSREICFVRRKLQVSRCLSGRARRNIANTAGELVTTDGEVVGDMGIHNTVRQPDLDWLRALLYVIQIKGTLAGWWDRGRLSPKFRTHRINLFRSLIWWADAND
jgi:hypothetical protein